MAEEKLCPLLREPCIREKCKLFLQLTITGTTGEGKAVTKNVPEQCAFIWAAMVGVKEMQLAGRPPQGRQRRKGEDVPAPPEKH